MADRLRDAVSPYLRAHAGNPVDWYPWGAEAFAAARERDVPVLVSIGYATCHWCHVMARESFSDPVVAEVLNRDFVSIKVDREEHPDVDSSYLAAASAFTRGLGWPLTVFATPDGRAFYAGTYFPPVPVQGTPSFGEVLAAVTEAWRERRPTLLETADAVARAIAAAASAATAAALPSRSRLQEAARMLAAEEDTRYGGFGPAPKFPVAPVLGFLAGIDADGRALAVRSLRAMADSPLFDRVEGGFFRYATRADWSEPHYERMLPDNALLLALAVELSRAAEAESWALPLAADIAGFLAARMQLPGGGFASAQDSESVIEGRRNEGGYYRLDASARAELSPPPLDEKILTGWNGLAIGSLADFALRCEDRDAAGAAMSDAAAAAELVLARHLGADGVLRRASREGVVSSGVSTLEDIGMLATGLLHLALASGEVWFAVQARDLIDRALADGAATTGGASPFAPPRPDPVLASLGLALPADPAEGAAPSGPTSCAGAAWLLAALGAGERYRTAAAQAMAVVAGIALERPMAFGAALELMSRLAEPETQLVTVLPEPSEARGASGAPGPAEPRGDGERDGGLVTATRRHEASVVAIVDEAQARAFAAAGFELFADRPALGGRPTAYRCAHFVCALPVHDADGLAAAAAGHALG